MDTQCKKLNTTIFRSQFIYISFSQKPLQFYTLVIFHCDFDIETPWLFFYLERPKPHVKNEIKIGKGPRRIKKENMENKEYFKNKENKEVRT